MAITGMLWLLLKKKKEEETALKLLILEHLLIRDNWYLKYCGIILEELD